MPRLVGWKLYFDDGSVFSSLNGRWEDAPADGIQVLVEFYEDGTKKLHLERDYYILDEGKAYGTNNLNPWLRKKREVKFGRWSADDKFKGLVAKAKRESIDTV